MGEQRDHRCSRTGGLDLIVRVRLQSLLEIVVLRRELAILRPRS